MSTVVVLSKPSWSERFAGFFKGLDRGLLGLLGCLCLLGLIIMYSAGFDNGSRFYDHGRNMLLAFGIMLTIAQVPPHQLARWAVPLYCVGVLLLIAVELKGVTKKGATRWLNMGVVIQPSEIMKIATPLMLAWWFQLREGTLATADFIVAAIIMIIPVGLIMKQPDLGTALLVIAASLAVIYFAGLSWKLIIPPIVMGIILVAFLVSFQDSLCAKGADWMVLHEYQRIRICTLLNPEADRLGAGFHVLQGLIAIGSGGVSGKGFMSGTQTHLEFIPERTTDFIFTTYAEEFGLIGTSFLLLLYLLLIWRALIIANRGSTLFARLIGGSIATIFFTYALVNIGMVSGILPVVGVPLPFISYGGTAMMILGLASGILLSVGKHRQLLRS